MNAVDSFEAAVGLQLPLEYKQFVSTHRAHDVPGLFVKYAGDRRDVRCLFDFETAEVSSNVPGVFGLISDAIPPGTVPIGVDWGDNFYLHVCSGPNAGSVVWWDHERFPGEDHVEEVSESFEKFLRNLVGGET